MDITDYVQVKQTIETAPDTRVGFGLLVDYCEAKWPHEVWKHIREIEIDSDIEHLRHWIWHTLATQPPPNSVEALYFGLSNPVLDDGTDSCDLHMSGSDEFDEDDEYWACSVTYEPRDQYFAKSRVLHEIYSLVTETEFASEGEYVLCLGYACLAIREIFTTLSFPPLPKGVGFDSGDLILVRMPEDNETKVHEGQLRLWED